MNRPKCFDCVFFLAEQFQLPKCKRKTEKLFSGQIVFAFCEDERHYEIGECGEDGKFFQPKEKEGENE